MEMKNIKKYTFADGSFYCGRFTENGHRFTANYSTKGDKCVVNPWYRLTRDYTEVANEAKSQFLAAAVS